MRQEPCNIAEEPVEVIQLINNLIKNNNTIYIYLDLYTYFIWNQLKTESE